MLQVDDKDFFTAIVSAGAILTGFCGSFLQFRIQREALYYRQPALSFERGEARDIVIGLSHFTTSFLLIIVATLLALTFGFMLPLLALAKATAVVTPRLVVSGLTASLILLLGYFCAELVHYNILNARLLNDRREWGRQKILMTVTFLLAGIGAVIAFLI